jgi:peptidoglycan/xylan/chitin deacetylase (PgdA/CDA1 family)
MASRVRVGAMATAAVILCGWLSSFGSVPAAADRSISAVPAPQAGAGNVRGSGKSVERPAVAPGRRGADLGRPGSGHTPVRPGGTGVPGTPVPTGTPSGEGPRTGDPLMGDAGAPRHIDCAKQKCVALTFDDGPGPKTGTLLRMLAERNVRATFFVVGRNAAAEPAVIRREIADGDPLRLAEQFRERPGRGGPFHFRGARAAGVTPVLMRPPYGSTDRTVAAVTRDLGLAQILWAVDPLDWKDRNSGIVTRRVVRGTKPGYIVLMHDIHPTTIAAVPAIIRALKAKGYVFATVPELLGTHLKPGRRYTMRKH